MSRLLQAVSQSYGGGGVSNLTHGRNGATRRVNEIECEQIAVLRRGVSVHVSVFYVSARGRWKTNGKAQIRICRSNGHEIMTVLSVSMNPR